MEASLKVYFEILTSQKYKVTLDSIIFGLQKFGGISNYWLNLINLLDDEFSKNLILPKGFSQNFSSSIHHKIEFIPHQISRYLPVKNFNQEDIFHSSYYRLPLNEKSKYVVTVYDFTYEKYTRGAIRRIHTIQKSKSFDRADAIICISENTKNDLLKYYPKISQEKLFVTHLGINDEIYFNNEPICNYDNYEVLFIGNRHSYKRFDLIVDALELNKEFTLGIVGPELNKAEREILNNKIPLRWKEYGFVDQDSLRKLYQRAFCFIFPSDYEGFGLPLIESMSCGCPVVASDRSCFREIAGDAASYADSQDPEVYLQKILELQDLETRSKLIQKGLKRSKEFSWQKTIDRTKDIYLRILD